MRRFVDISIPLENDVPSDPLGGRPRIKYFDHRMTVPEIQKYFPDLYPSDLPDGAAWAYEEIQLSTHNGTHLDAPWHFHPTMNQALGAPEPAWTIDQVPLEWCFAPGVKLDFRHFPNGYVVTVADIQAELKRIGYELRPLDIVLVNTRAGERYGSPDYIFSGCGMGRAATRFLLDQGVRLAGTDAWSWDEPFTFARDKVAKTGDTSLVWEGHKVGRDIGYCHLEKLHHLEKLPHCGFTVSCFPVKIQGASAGWTRAVAIIDD